MAFNDAKQQVFKIDDTGATIRALTAYIDEVRGIPGPRNLNEVTALGDGGAKFIPGLENSPFSITGSYDDTATTGPDAVLGPLRTHTSAVDFEYYPNTTGSGKVKYSGKCWVTDYRVTGRVGSQVRYECDLQVEGQVTRATV